MKIGNYKVYSILTSQFSLDGGAMFGIIPKTLWEKEAPADNYNRISMVTRSLLLIGNDRKIIIDTGNGDKWDKKFRSIYNIKLDKVNLNSSLLKVGLSPDDITDVFCTHLHFDHAGGNTTYQNEQIVPTFQNASYWVHSDNWNLANSPSEKDRGSYLEENWKVLAQNNMIQFINDKNQFLPGINLFVSNGHTTGMMHPIITDNSKTLFYAADIFPMASHIPLSWIMAYDIDPVQIINEKKYLLSKIVDEDWIVFFEHDPITQAGKVGFNNGKFNLKERVVFSE
ncbi:MAG: MBL fold metallo-hydrolase [Candidatus Neomarinimicrobiota bacterium]|tara:strand:+ start:4985 stop:5833 length:849 start_codon:yes stop_codon:yes gene_type:complete